jgi:hypothetical protein
MGLSLLGRSPDLDRLLLRRFLGKLGGVALR